MSGMHLHFTLRDWRYIYKSIGMIMGACLEADSRIREYEAKIRMQKRMVRDRAVWDRYEQEYGEPTPASKPR